MLAMLIGCGGGSGEEQAVESAGRMCLHAAPPAAFPNPEPQTFAADTPITVRVELTACLSSSCDLDRAMSCSVAATGTSIAVTSLATWVTRSTNGCTDDCGLLATTCTTEALTAGSYQIAFGGETLALTVPSDTAEQPCLDVAISAD